MTDHTPTPEQIKAFLDDLARISLRHGLCIANGEVSKRIIVEGTGQDFSGYDAEIGHPSNRGEITIACLKGWSRDAFRQFGPPSVHISSIDITQLSAHERLEILGARPHDTDPLLSEAVRLLRAWVAWCDGPADPHPLDSLREAKEFLARIDRRSKENSDY